MKPVKYTFTQQDMRELDGSGLVAKYGCSMSTAYAAIRTWNATHAPQPLRDQRLLAAFRLLTQYSDDLDPECFDANHPVFKLQVRLGSYINGGVV
jgi:hypothetical protein